MCSDQLEGAFDREEVLAGSPAKRANALLFLIESRTAHLVARSKQALERFLTEAGAQERELAFVEAFALGRDPPLRPTIQDLERHSSEWASLVPRNARVQAAVARRLGQKYEFTAGEVAGLRAALGLDEPDVREAYQRLYKEPLESIYTPRAGLRNRLQWAWARLATRLETLPPFWTAYSLTLTETVGATILALPIALAEVGPLPGVAILIVLGLVNVLTVAFMAEAIARSGTIRYGRAFFGRVVGDYLGRGGAAVLTAGLFLLFLLVLPVFYIGFGATLEDATRVPAAVWVALLFLVALYYLRRQSLTATIASALVVGAVNIGLVVVLSLLAFTHVRSGNLLYEHVPFVGGRPFDAAIVALVFGVVLAAYFGHTSVAICGQLVLRRDPTARSLIWGCAAAQATAMLVYCLFVFAVNGAVTPAILAHESGTAISPLAEEVGPAVLVLGSVFAALGLGMVSITFNLALFGLARERLPPVSPVVVILPRRRARLLFEERGRGGRVGSLKLGLVYLGLDEGEPRFRLDAEHAGHIERLEATVGGRWELLGASDSSELVDAFPDLRDQGGELTLEVVAADQPSARVRVTSSLRLAYDGAWDVAGLSLGELLELPESQADLVGWITRRGEVTLAEVAERTGRDTGAARVLVESLVERGVVARTGSAPAPRYAPRVAARRGGRLTAEIWRALAAPEASEGVSSELASNLSPRARRVRQALLGRTGRFALGAAPVLAAFLAAEWMVLTGSGSFAGLLNFVGTIIVSLLAGIFPVFLLIASRRKGEHSPAAAYRILGNPVLLSGIYVLFLASVFLHGLVIWDDALKRGGALLAGSVMVAMTVSMARRGAFSPRVNIELRDDPSEGGAAFAVTAAGRPAVCDVRLEYLDGERRVRAAGGQLAGFASLQRLTFDAPRDGEEEIAARELKVWAHKITPERDSEGLPARVDVHLDQEICHFDLALSRGQVTLPLPDGSCRVDITLASRS
jgi:amino acid permease